MPVSINCVAFGTHMKSPEAVAICVQMEAKPKGAVMSVSQELMSAWIRGRRLTTDNVPLVIRWIKSHVEIRLLTEQWT